MLYRALIQPYFEYCSSVWDGLSAQLSDKLQKLQNRAARVLTRTNYDTRSSFLRNLLGWESLDILRKRQKAILVFKALNGLTPSYLQNLFTKAKYSNQFFEKKFYVQWSLPVEQPPRRGTYYQLSGSV